MTEYMKKRAAQAGQLNNEAAAQAPMTNGIPNSALLSVFEGKTKATSQMMGHKENLAPSVAAKMSQAFGMNFMDMQVYRSDAMKGTGMQGLTQGNKVIISSDVDLNTTRGQAVLGHEFSHVHAQSQGIGMGHSGLYENASLEAQADREGLLAAEGRPIYGDPMSMNPGMSYGLGMQGVEGLTPIGGGLSATAGAPMQASMKDDIVRAYNELLENKKMPMGTFGSLPKKKSSSFAPRGHGQQRVPRNYGIGKQPRSNSTQSINKRSSQKVVPQGIDTSIDTNIDEAAAPFVNEVLRNDNKSTAKRLQDSSAVVNADLRDFDPRFAKVFNKAFKDAKKDFPDLKMNYCGTVENQIEGIHHIIADEYEKALRAKNGDKIPDEVYKKMASEYADGEIIRQKLIDDRDIFGHSLQMPEGPYSKFNGIAISKKYASDNDFFNKEKEKETDSKNKPVGCNTSKATVDHELGHEIDRMVNASKDKFINELYDQFMKEEKPEEKLSGYAKTNVAEFIAEGYSEYRNNPEPRDYSTKIYNRLKELYEQRGNE